MTSSVKVTAHCGSQKVVKIFLDGQLSETLQDGESRELHIYDDRVVSAREEKKPEFLPPHQQRVVDEKLALNDKIGLLTNFTLTLTFLVLPEAEQKRLRTQRSLMVAYADVLGERIAAFNVEA